MNRAFSSSFFIGQKACYNGIGEKMSTYVIFDMDGTLYDLYPPFALAAWQCLGENTPPKPLLQAIFAASRRYSDQLRAQGSIDQAQLVWRRSQLAFAEYGWKLSKAQCVKMQQAYADAQASLCMEPAMRTLLESLLQAGAKLALLSNGDAKHQRQKANRLGVDAYIPPQRQFFSGMIHCDKPDPRIFRWVETQLPLTAEDSIWYVGDDRRVDVDGARNAGWHSIWSRAYLPLKDTDDRVIEGAVDDLDQLRIQLLAIVKGREENDKDGKR